MSNLKRLALVAVFSVLTAGAASAQSPHPDYAQTPNGKLVLEWFNLWAVQGKDKEAFSDKYVLPTYVHHVQGKLEPVSQRLSEVEEGRRQIPTWNEKPLSVFAAEDLVFLTSLRDYGKPGMAPSITSRLFRVKDGKIAEDYMLGHTDPKALDAARAALPH